MAEDERTIGDLIDAIQSEDPRACGACGETFQGGHSCPAIMRGWEQGVRDGRSMARIEAKEAARAIPEVVGAHVFTSWSTNRKTRGSSAYTNHAGCTCDPEIEFDWVTRYAKHLEHLYQMIFEAGRRSAMAEED